MRDCLRLVVALMLSSILVTTASGEVRYYATDLGILPGGTSSYAYGINNSGQVVGEADTSGIAKVTTP